MRRRLLGTELRKYRELAGLTGDQVIERAGWASASKLSRLENGKSRPEVRDILDLLDIYEVSEIVRRDIMEITKGAGDMRNWLRQFPNLTPRQRKYAELEAGCSEIREYSPVIIPGLLQTREYARVRFVSSLPLSDPHDREKDDIQDPDTEVEARVERQSILEGTAYEPPSYTAILEEDALSGPAGPPEVIQAQLNHLIKMAGLRHVTIRMLRRHTKLRGFYLPHTGFSLYRFADPRDGETAAIEGLSRNLMISEKNELHGYKVMFEWLEEAALSEESTLTWLADAAEQASGGSPAASAIRGAAMPPTQRTPHAGRLTEP
ncbi:helix-turn-helix domain-containing protein [Plantactinospora sp. GCM10030261]|uniref:helix-turn-helix domain-containing protein n=1 Tax=Plantactinospora sp. GCM10030261 TaxID=3273420 RepID=UPI003615E759